MKQNNILKNKMFLLLLLTIAFCVVFKPSKSFSIYKEILPTILNLSISSNDAVLVTFDSDGGSTVPSRSVVPGQTVGTLPIPTKANSNFVGWFDENDQRVRHTTVINAPTELHAVWANIVCKRVTSQSDLHTETCTSSGGCITAGIAAGSTITYGTIGDGIPEAGDAYNCDVDYDGVFDSKESDNKTFIERFYFVREKENVGSDNTAVMYYSTSFDNIGRDNRSISDNDINSTDYLTALSYLPSSTLWDNPSLIDLDGNGRVSRFLTAADIESIYGPIVTKNTNYLKQGNKWFWYENTRFQSNTLGRSGIWLEKNNDVYLRLQAHSFYVEIPDKGSASENMTRPVMELPLTALEGYYDEDVFTISFNTFEGDANVPSSINKYRGEEIGTLPTVTREHHEFLGWYTDSGYENLVDQTALVSGNITLYAKWQADAGIQVKLNLDGGTISGVTSPIIVNYGETISSLPDPEKPGMTFLGWYTDSGFNNQFDPTVPITADMTLYAKWELGNYVARIGDVYYAALAEALDVNELGSGKTTVTILKDITLTSPAVIPSGKWVELDVQNYTLSTSSCNLINNSGKLDIINGTLTSSYSASNTGQGYVIYNKAGGTLNISGGLLTQTNSSATESKVLHSEGTEVNITGGKLECNSKAATINVYAGTLNISGGEVIATGTEKGQAIYMETKDNSTPIVNISGDAYLSNVTATSGNQRRAAVDNNSSTGILTITGGTIISQNYFGVANRSTGSTIIGINDDGGNIIDTTTPVIQGKTHALYPDKGTTTVYDGVFKGETGATSKSVTIPSGTSFVQHGTEDSHKVFYLEKTSGGPYTVTFDSDNTDPTTQVSNISAGNTVGVNMPADPTKTNYIFEKWFIYKEVDSEVIYDGEFTSSTPVEDDITVKAKWKPSIGVATVSPNNISIEVDETATIAVTGPADMESYTFSSSNTNIATVDNNGVVKGITSGNAVITITGAISGDTKVVPVGVSEATVKYSITFKNGSEVIKSITVTSGENISAEQMPNDPSKTGYYFIGWYKEGTNTQITTSTPINQNIVAVSKWKEKITTATITPSSITLYKGLTQQITISPTDLEDTVESVTYSSSASSVATVDNTGLVTAVGEGTAVITITGSDSQEPVNINVTVSVLYNTVRFDKKDGSQNPIISIQVEDETQIGSKMPNDPTRTGYVFIGWFEKNDHTKRVTSVTQIDDALDVDAIWEENVQFVTVTPDPISLIVGATQQITVSETVQGDTYESYSFTSNDSTVATVSNSGLVTAVGVGTTTITMTGSDSTLTRSINVTVKTEYTVSFETFGGTQINPIQVAIGGTVDSQMPNDPTRTNSVFAGWYNQDYTQSYDENTVVNSDMTFYAKWTPSSAAVCEMNGQYYTSIQDAVDAINTSNVTTINLLKDVSSNLQTKDGKVVNVENKKVIFDLQTHSFDYIGGKKVYVIFLKNAEVEVRNGTITSNADGSAAIQVGSNCIFTMNDGEILISGNRQAVNNEGGTVLIGGTTRFEANTNEQYNNVERATVQNMSGTMTITGGTIVNTLGAAVSVGGGTVTFGTADGTIDTTNLVMQGQTYGLWIKSGVTVTVNDGMFKGVLDGINTINQASNQMSQPANTEFSTGGEEQIGGVTFKQVYLYSNLTPPTPSTYTITLNPNGGSVGIPSVTVNSGNAVDNLPVPTRGVYSFDGWYTSQSGGTLIEEGVTEPTQDTTYFARWSYTSNKQIKTYSSINSAIDTYQTYISTWKNNSSNFPTWTEQNNANNNFAQDNVNTTAMLKNFYDNGCECTTDDVQCKLGGSTQCDKPTGYYIGDNEQFNVYLYDEVNETKGAQVDYAKASNGVINNLIPNQAYYWEKASDTSMYGVVKYTGNRRILDTGDVRNTRDLGGLTATDNNGNTIGHLKYGRLFRGIRLKSSSSVTELTNLGINSELDLRETEDSNKLSRFNRIEAQNYYVNPFTTTNPAHTPESDEMAYYSETRAAVKYAMEEIVDNKNLYFHCRIGTDRTGTVAYVLEGLLGVPEEERIQDYELSFFYGLVRIHRYHNQKPGSSVGTGHERFVYMHDFMPSNSLIYDWYMYGSDNVSADEDLITAFRSAMIESN